MDTIFAVSSGAPPAAIAVIRISGPGAFAAGEQLAGKLPPDRRAALRVLSRDGVVLDNALVLCFPGPHTATGEDLLELHCHGGRAVVRAVEDALAQLDLRRADPGEFTRRALLHGRIDLSEAEGLADLLQAETETQRRAAMRSAEGELSQLVADWQTRLLEIAAAVEAELDHDDEEDVHSAGGSRNVWDACRALAGEIATVVARPAVERLRDGVRVVFAGPPNAGKSTLFNHMAGRAAAIVSPIAGTTRDRIEAPVVRGGVSYLLIDTAGLSTADTDAIEAIGIDLAQEAMKSADILLWFGDDPAPERPAAIWLRPRCDIADTSADRDLAVSGRTGQGVEALWLRIEALARAMLPPPDLVALNERQRTLCAAAAASCDAAGTEGDLLLLAEHLRGALRSFDAVTGSADTEAVLDTLFARFCIGK